MSVSQNFPTIRPTLNLDFANTKILDPRITFTRGSTGTYVDENGVIQSAASGEARFDHDPVTGESLGLLIEEERTNYFQYSEQFSNGYWTVLSNTSIIPNSTIAPDGTLTATKLVSGTAVDSTSSIRTTNTVYGIGGEGRMMVSLFVKPAGYNYVALSGGNGASQTIFDLVNLTSTNTGGSPVPLDGTIESYPNGWYRVTFKPYRFSSASHYTISVTDNASSTTFTGDGSSGIYIWGAQIEEKVNFHTSYIPTAGSTVTRAADVTQITGSNFSSWYNQSGGTYFLDVTTVDSGTTDSIVYDGYIEIRDYIGAGIRRRNINSPLVGGVYQFVFNPAQAPVSKVAVAFDSTSANAAYAGVLQTLDTSISDLPNSATSLLIGGTGPSQMNKGHISRLTYYPQRLSDTQLQNLTK